ncbi:hypothetical protein BCR42DRAFT_421413 [Absidia repens]|uniref:Uncharacterized protein n=1 Tax=Absidia repens TaxID=90262 RepID=A0A1X2I8V1_9FUNG|nr:hypothetical protein BCR42DRAFT_421413 [Absidia repens]
MDKLVQLDNEFFDSIDVPKDQVLRQLLSKYSHCVMADHPSSYNFGFVPRAEAIVEALYDASQTDSPTNHHSYEDATTGKIQTQADRYASFEDLFDGMELKIDWKSCIVWHGKRDDFGPILSWKDFLSKRNEDIAYVMAHLADLIIDWSSRAWVISEYHIAMKKNNLKYWFTEFRRRHVKGLPFFKFDFRASISSYETEPGGVRGYVIGSMLMGLTTESFLEDILNSKASKNEDRFYAILPHSKYDDKINQVADWKINTMTSVKLKLFEIMNAEDKLKLLFSVGQSINVMSQLIPTFATPTVHVSDAFLFSGEVDLPNLFNKSAISIHHRAHESQLYHCLQLTPKGYRVQSKPYNEELLQYANTRKEILCSHLQLDEDSLEIDFVKLSFFDRPPSYYQSGYGYLDVDIYLTGSFLKNKWILDSRDMPKRLDKWDYYDNNNTATVFDIY